MSGAAFYVYENWTNTFTKVHRGDCPFCKNGEGFQGRGNSTQSGRWLGPFPSSEAANVAAQAAVNVHPNRDVWDVGTCGYCRGI